MCVSSSTVNLHNPREITFGVLVAVATILVPRVAVSDTTTAVLYHEIWDWGFITSEMREDSMRPMVYLLADPNDTTVVDSLPPGTAVKYERWSELRRLAPIKLLFVEGARGEWYRITTANSTGWIPDRNLTTLLGSDWGTDPAAYCKSTCRNDVVAIYRSGQYWTSQSFTLTLWRRDDGNERWILVDVVLDAIGAGLYTGATVGSITCEHPDTLVHLGASGGDGGDHWGENAIYRINNGKFQTVKREPFHEDGDQ